MKRIIYSISAVAVIALAAVNVNLALNGEDLAKLGLVNIIALADTESTTPGENGEKPPCVDSIDRSEAIIKVTVCRRKTNTQLYLDFQISCSDPDDGSCTFYNMP